MHKSIKSETGAQRAPRGDPRTSGLQNSLRRLMIVVVRCAHNKFLALDASESRVRYFLGLLRISGGY